MFQYNTLSKSVEFHGVGIHNNATVTLSVEPGLVSSGIQFVRSDLSNAVVSVSSDTLSIEASQRHTVLDSNGVYIRTPEHLLASLYALEIYDATIYIDHDEVPIMDGSAKVFTDKFIAAGLEPVSSSLEPLVIPEPMVCSDGDRRILAFPSPDFRCGYLLSYPESFVGTQFFSSVISPDSFLSDISPARTFGFEHEITALLEKGLAKGASLDNAVVVGESGYINPLRFDDELVRHKVLDMVGDLSILARPIQGHILGICSGHSLNAALVHDLSNKC